MPGPSGYPNIAAMRGRRKGGAIMPQPRSSQGLAAQVAGFLERLAVRGYSHASIEGHQWALRQFTEWASTNGLENPPTFTRDHLESYQRFLHHYRSPRTGCPLGINTQLARLGCVRRFFANLCRAGIIPANPAADLDLPRKQARQLPKTLNPDEIARLLAIPNTADPFGLRDRAILELFYATGIRRSEMANLDLTDYDPHNHTLTIRMGKNGKSRMLPVGERAATWLERFLAESRSLFDHLPSESALFLTGYGTRFSPAYLGNWIKKLMKRCGIDKPGSCHLWRHSCATDMHRGGADIRYVQEMLGHARMETTQIYTHIHIDALRDVHTRCHPHGRLRSKSELDSPLDSDDAAAAQSALAPTSPNENVPVTVDSSSQSSPGLLIAVSAMSTAVQPETLSTGQAAGLSAATCDTPPGEDPPAGNMAHHPTPRPHGPEGANSCNPPAKNAPDRRRPPVNDMGVTFYGYRYYDPVTGRWPSRDPIEEYGGINLHAFVGNNGISRIDLYGLKSCTSQRINLAVKVDLPSWFPAQCEGKTGLRGEWYECDDGTKGFKMAAFGELKCKKPLRLGLIPLGTRSGLGLIGTLSVVAEGRVNIEWCKERLSTAELDVSITGWLGVELNAYVVSGSAEGGADFRLYTGVTETGSDQDAIYIRADAALKARGKLTVGRGFLTYDYIVEGSARTPPFDFLALYANGSYSIAGFRFND